MVRSRSWATPVAGAPTVKAMPPGDAIDGEVRGLGAVRRDRSEKCVRVGSADHRVPSLRMPDGCTLWASSAGLGRLESESGNQRR